MKQTNWVIALYKAHGDAEAAVKLLHKTGINMKQCSIVGQGYHTEEEVVGYYNAGDRMKFWGKEGAFWGGVWGLLFGSGVFWIPGIGQIMAGGAIVSSIVGALEVAAVAGSLSALGAALYSIGIPENSILQYEAAIKANKFIVIIHGTAGETEKAREILDATTNKSLEMAGKEEVAAYTNN